MLAFLKAASFYYYITRTRNMSSQNKTVMNSDTSSTGNTSLDITPVEVEVEVEAADTTPVYKTSVEVTPASVDRTSVEMAEDEQRGRDTAFKINRKIFVGNISYRIKSRKLTKFFWKFGPVEHCYIVKDHLKGWSRGIAFVTFRDEESMRKALNATEDELVLDERQMRVKPAELSNKTTFWQNDSSSEGEEDWDSTNQSDLKIQSHDQAGDQSETTTGVHINDLFDEILIHIFTMMSFKERVGVERVCRRWKNVVQASWVTYRSLSFQNFFRNFGAGLTDKNLNSALQRCGPCLERLDLSGSPALLTDFSMNVIGNYCPHLKELDISSVKITDISLKNLVSKCTGLQRVTLKRCRHITEKKGVKALLESSPELVHVDLSHNLQITGECFRVAGPRLRNVFLSKCLMVTDKCLFHLAKNCPQLEELNLSGCKGLTCEGLKYAVQNFRALKILDIGSTSIANPAIAFCGLINLQNLEYLDVSYNTEFGDTCLGLIAQNCPKLRYLDISACCQITDVGMSSLASLHLQALNISFLNRQNQMETSLVKIAAAGTLRKFIARASSFLINQDVMQIIASSPHLEYLDLSDCFNITNQIFEAFKNSVVDESKTVELYLGGTSVDWVGEDIDWVTGFSHLKVFMMSSGFYQSGLDRPFMMTEMDDQSDEENEYAPHRPISDYLPEGPIEAYDDWQEGYDGFDDFLDNNDPLEDERWDMS